ncbi:MULTISPECIES: TetR/AcrR family transcriptional regulator [unclassified Oceanobacter]|uniref:TetR/AcrR family transcriptional regulator n=2 Tax=Gammaproteobacteria TaxID=1236 RepID=UPI002735BAE4|nr:MULTISPECIES: TetR/AcrR family transcriptional regulator [unclassified Oceanobacter]MDP2609061.1 TetR/AcrR family transcriptional regulator [Oceanobacter sp. 1_MG-2023]MDP2612383.1 TetR/AcrR family transcriptional regulator [Oceanobacter sp. 2_MG-2023]
MDIRREKSRKKLRNALAELLKKRPLEQISIEQIADKAGVTRPTFYSNYQNRQDIIIEHIEQWLAQREQLFQNFLEDEGTPEPDRLVDFIQHLLETLCPDDTLLQLALSGRAGEQALQRILNQNTDFFRRGASRSFNEPPSEDDILLISTFYGSATIGIISGIISGNIRQQPAELAQQLADMIYNGIGHRLL